MTVGKLSTSHRYISTPISCSILELKECVVNGTAESTTEHDVMGKRPDGSDRAVYQPRCHRQQAFQACPAAGASCRYCRDRARQRSPPGSGKERPTSRTSGAQSAHPGRCRTGCPKPAIAGWLATPRWDSLRKGG